jgi:hypothetical protein
MMCERLISWRLGRTCKILETEPHTRQLSDDETYDVDCNRSGRAKRAGEFGSSKNSPITLPTNQKP